MKSQFIEFLDHLRKKNRFRRNLSIKVVAVIFVFAEIYSVAKKEAFISRPYDPSFWGYMLDGFWPPYKEVGILPLFLSFLFLIMPLIVSLLAGLRANLFLICMCVIVILFARNDINDIYTGNFTRKGSSTVAITILLHIGCVVILPAEWLVRFLSRKQDTIG